MTSAIFSRGASRRTVRAAAVAAALAGALALTACSGDGGSGDGSATTPAATDGGGPSGASASPSDPDSVSAADELEGSWLATTDGKAVALIITGKQAALFGTGGSVCSGTAGKESGMRMIHLTCTVGKDDRATGMVDSVDAESLEVTWSGAAGKETFTRAQDGQWPSGMPTAGIG
ncbi:hypothetical protein ACWGH3_32225 [Streptomyces sp. NPDC054884]|uniref:hypothetical protein n=1 Tax=Streptomyces sp. ME08-AFT2 TaxID=3028683 RepID=UPI0029BA3993|nr:hypothetical protein [Streptomyces sp. ME08-AFT2]MDX3312007.1 hypothetical protein [Streptomyces sp. ME08-AFT2]